MPCGDAGRERHARSYLLIATNKQPFVPWRGTGREVSPRTRLEPSAAPTSTHPTQVNGKAIQTQTDRAHPVAATGQTHLP